MTGNFPGIETPFWDEYKANNSNSWLPSFMIFYINIFYIATEVFIFIILMNFFIAQVGQVYARMLSRARTTRVITLPMATMSTCWPLALLILQGDAFRPAKCSIYCWNGSYN
jgi:hypothetical protein